MARHSDTSCSSQRIVLIRDQDLPVRGDHVIASKPSRRKRDYSIGVDDLPERATFIACDLPPSMSFYTAHSTSFPDHGAEHESDADRVLGHLAQSSIDIDCLSDSRTSSNLFRRRCEW